MNAPPGVDSDTSGEDLTPPPSPPAPIAKGRFSLSSLFPPALGATKQRKAAQVLRSKTPEQAAESPAASRNPRLKKQVRIASEEDVAEDNSKISREATDSNHADVNSLQGAQPSPSSGSDSSRRSEEVIEILKLLLAQNTLHRDDALDMAATHSHQPKPLLTDPSSPSEVFTHGSGSHLTDTVSNPHHPGSIAAEPQRLRKKRPPPSNLLPNVLHGFGNMLGASGTPKAGAAESQASDHPPGLGPAKVADSTQSDHSLTFPAGPPPSQSQSEQSSTCESCGQAFGVPASPASHPIASAPPWLWVNPNPPMPKPVDQSPPPQTSVSPTVMPAWLWQQGSHGRRSGSQSVQYGSVGQTRAVTDLANAVSFYPPLPPFYPHPPSLQPFNPWYPTPEPTGAEPSHPQRSDIAYGGPRLSPPLEQDPTTEIRNERLARSIGSDAAGIGQSSAGQNAVSHENHQPVHTTSGSPPQTSATGLQPTVMAKGGSARSSHHPTRQHATGAQKPKAPNPLDVSPDSDRSQRENPFAAQDSTRIKPSRNSTTDKRRDIDTTEPKLGDSSLPSMGCNKRPPSSVEALRTQRANSRKQRRAAFVPVETTWSECLVAIANAINLLNVMLGVVQHDQKHAVSNSQADIVIDVLGQVLSSLISQRDVIEGLEHVLGTNQSADIRLLKNELDTLGAFLKSVLQKNSLPPKHAKTAAQMEQRVSQNLQAEGAHRLFLRMTDLSSLLTPALTSAIINLAKDWLNGDLKVKSQVITNVLKVGMMIQHELSESRRCEKQVGDLGGDSGSASSLMIRAIDTLYLLFGSVDDNMDTPQTPSTKATSDGAAVRTRHRLSTTSNASKTHRSRHGEHIYRGAGTEHPRPRKPMQIFTDLMHGAARSEQRASKQTPPQSDQHAKGARVKSRAKPTERHAGKSHPDRRPDIAARDDVLSRDLHVATVADLTTSPDSPQPTHIVGVPEFDLPSGEYSPHPASSPSVYSQSSPASEGTLSSDQEAAKLLAHADSGPARQRRGSAATSRILSRPTAEQVSRAEDVVFENPKVTKTAKS